VLKNFIIILFFIVCAPFGFSQYTTFTSIDYIGNDNPRQTLDLYIPDDITQKAPLIIFIHGGGWHSGGTENVLAWCDTLLANNFIVAAINYRFSQDSIFPAQIYDCKAAVRWLKANADLYSIDTSKIGLIGVSAGAHLASLIGLSSDVPLLEDLSQGNSNFKSKVNAVVEFYGPSNLLEMSDYSGSDCPSPRNYDEEGSVVTQLLGCIAADCPETALFASPISYVDTDDPPFLIYHGTSDCVVPNNQSIKLYSKLVENNVDAHLNIIEGVAHGDSIFYNSNSKVEVLNFFNEKLNNICQACDSSKTDTGNEIKVFPNPFNSITTIEYYVSSEGQVQIFIFDMLGRKLKEVLNESRSTGVYKAVIEGVDLASGVYLGVVKTPNSVQTIKIIHIK
jgi:acetyl esterase/lipase